MRSPFYYGVGGVVSADIAVPEHERECEFYSGVLTTGNAPLWQVDLMNNLGAPIIGLGQRTPEYETLPLQWMPHFQVADVANSVATATQLGGKVLFQSDGEEMQWAVITDPNGATFGIIPAVASAPENAPANERQGHISWLSLAVPNVEQSCDFYQKVIGWTAQEASENESEQRNKKFDLNIAPSIVAGEIVSTTVETDIPSVWMVHLPVDNYDESIQKVGQLGGKVVKDFEDSKRAIVQDPIGVFFAVQAAQ